MRRAAQAGIAILALTDHDTVAGVPEAVAEADAVGIRVIAGCEFSVAAPWGEMHLLAYFLPAGDSLISEFLAQQRAKRAARARRMVTKLNALGVAVTDADVLEAAGGGAVGRPHVARALVARGAVAGVAEAFDRYLGWGRPAFVPKDLPDLATVTDLVHRAAGLTSAAHLKDRATRAALAALVERGVDAVEVLHPSHDESTRRRVLTLAGELGLLPTGGSDWHGDGAAQEASHAPLGAEEVPREWVDALERRRSSML